jgi:ligand-binding sensor domain-containing protein/DNA-binding CsgD family transcriptional regulator
MQKQMKLKKSCAVLGILLASTFYLHSQTDYLAVDRIMANAPPMQMEICAVLLDSRGFLWIGSQNGLARYDGYRVVPCSLAEAASPPAADPSVRSIREDQNGRLWLATAQGLVRYDPASGTSVRFRHDPRRTDTISADDITCLYISAAIPGRLWIAAAGGDLDELDLASARVMRHPSGPATAGSPRPGRIHVISGDPGGFLWIGAINGLYRFQPLDGSLQRCPQPDAASGPLNPVSIKAILSDERFPGTLWIGSENAGLLRYLPATGLWQHCSEPGNLPADVRINAVTLFPGEPQNLLLATDSGLYRFDPRSGRFTPIALLFENDDLISSPCTQIVSRDPLGCYWIGTCRTGLAKWSPVKKKFTYFRPFAGALPNPLANWVTSLHEPNDRDILLTTYGGGALIFDRRTSTFRRLLLDPAKPGRKLNSFIGDSQIGRDGSLWFATVEGLARCFASGRLQRFYGYSPDPSSAKEITVFGFIQDARGLNWIGSDHGLIRLDPENGDRRQYRHDRLDRRSLSNDRINSIMMETSNALWIGTDDGLNLHQPGSDGFAVFRNDPADPASLSNNQVYAVNQDSLERIWICTANGLSLLRREGRKVVFRNYLAPGSDPRQNSFNALVEENSRYFWLGSKAGLARFDSERGTFTFYDRRDGVVADGMNEAFFFFRSRDQEIFFGGRRGFTVFRPAAFALNLHPPPLVVTDLRIEQDVSSTHAMNATGKKNVRVELAALDFMRPEKNQYAYLLEGRDRDWTYQGTDRVVLLSGLPVGTYTLRAKAANNDGIWNETGIEIKIKVRLPFHEQYGFALLIAGLLAVLATVVLMLRRRSRRLQAAAIPENLDAILEKFAISKREAEIVRLLLAGKSNKEIEDLLFIAMATVKIHVHNIFQKVKVNNRLQLLLRIQQEERKLK